MSAAAPAPAGRAAAMIRTMAGVGALCGLLIVGVYVATAPVIERNRAAALERAVFEVLPAARSTRPYRLAASGGFAPAPAAGGGERVHAAWDERGRLVGFAVPAAGMGYQDVIRLLYGYDPARDAIVGVRVLESRETPGLGDRIESDPYFLASFEHLDVSLAADGAGLAHPIAAVKHGEPRAAWEIDGITGATVSSTAVARILDESAARWVPLLRGRLDDFRAEAGRP